MARILKLECFALAAENRTDPVRKWSSLSRICARCRFTHLEVVGTFGVVLPGHPICLSKGSPGFVDGNDSTRFVDNRYVRGEAVQRPLQLLAALGFSYPGSLLASERGKQ